MQSLQTNMYDSFDLQQDYSFTVQDYNSLAGRSEEVIPSLTDNFYILARPCIKTITTLQGFLSNELKK